MNPTEDQQQGAQAAEASRVNKGKHKLSESPPEESRRSGKAPDESGNLKDRIIVKPPVLPLYDDEFIRPLGSKLYDLNDKSAPDKTGRVQRRIPVIQEILRTYVHEPPRHVFVHKLIYVGDYDIISNKREWYIKLEEASRDQFVQSIDDILLMAPTAGSRMDYRWWKHFDHSYQKLLTSSYFHEGFVKYHEYLEKRKQMKLDERSLANEKPVQDKLEQETLWYEQAAERCKSVIEWSTSDTDGSVLAPSYQDFYPDGRDIIDQTGYSHSLSELARILKSTDIARFLQCHQSYEKSEHHKRKGKYGVEAYLSKHKIYADFPALFAILPFQATQVDVGYRMYWPSPETRVEFSKELEGYPTVFFDWLDGKAFGYDNTENRFPQRPLVDDYKPWPSSSINWGPVIGWLAEKSGIEERATIAEEVARREAEKERISTLLAPRTDIWVAATFLTE